MSRLQASAWPVLVVVVAALVTDALVNERPEDIQTAGIADEEYYNGSSGDRPYKNTPSSQNMKTDVPWTITVLLPPTPVVRWHELLVIQTERERPGSTGPDKHPGSKAPTFIFPPAVNANVSTTATPSTATSTAYIFGTRALSNGSSARRITPSAQDPDASITDDPLPHSVVAEPVTEYAAPNNVRYFEVRILNYQPYTIPISAVTVWYEQEGCVLSPDFRPVLEMLEASPIVTTSFTLGDSSLRSVVPVSLTNVALPIGGTTPSVRTFIFKFEYAFADPAECGIWSVLGHARLQLSDQTVVIPDFRFYIPSP